jgi:rhomboid protease GluP
VSSVLVITVLVGAIVGGLMMLQLRKQPLRLPIATIVVAVVVTAVSVVGELNAEVLHTLGRHVVLLPAGEWWRAVTPLFVQDGGWPGLIFNVIALLVVGAVAESMFKHWFVPLVFMVVGLLGELAAYTLFTGQGFAGNSVANLGIAGVLLVMAVSTPDLRVRAAGVLGLLAGLALLVSGNLHGVGVAAGAAIGVTLLSQRLNARTRISVSSAAPGNSGESSAGS